MPKNGTVKPVRPYNSSTRRMPSGIMEVALGSKKIPVKRSRDAEGDDEVAGVDSGSKGLVHTLFAPELGDELALAAGYGKKYDYRGVLEPTGAKTQCDNVIGKFVANTQCYLCGQPIPSIVGKTSSHELYPECEHILPVTEARWYLDLYMSRPTTELGEWTQKALELEYAYAHRVCNQAKSNISFVKPAADGVNLQTSDKGFLRILTNIRNRAKGAINKNNYLPDQLKIITNIRDTILTRGKVILDEKIRPILNHVSRPDDDVGIMLLARTALVSNIQLMRPEVQKKFNDFKGPSLEEKNRIQKDLIDQVYTEYPVFVPEKLTEIVSTNEYLTQASPAGGWKKIADAVVTRTLVDRILTDYFKGVSTIKKGHTDNEVEPMGEDLPNVVFYGAYEAMFKALKAQLVQKEKEDDIKNAKALCQLYEQLLSYFAVERLASLLRALYYSPPSERDGDVLVACGKAGRALRALKRGAEPQSDAMEVEDAEDVEEPLTKDDAYMYYFGDLNSRLITAGLPADVAGYVTELVTTKYGEVPFSADDPLDSLTGTIRDVVGAASLVYGSDIVQKVETALTTLGNEGYLGEEDNAAVFATAAQVDRDGDQRMQRESNAAAGSAGAGAGPQGGKRIGGRRPLYG